MEILSKKKVLHFRRYHLYLLLLTCLFTFGSVVMAEPILKAEPDKTTVQTAKQTSQKHKPQLSETKTQLEFDEIRAFKLLSDIVQFGQRFYGASHRDKAIQHLVKGLQEAGSQKVELQQFNQIEPGSKQNYQLTNVIARIFPERSARVILGSHWDTRLWAEEDHNHARHNEPITGANDGSSGLAVLLEVLRQIKGLQLKQIGVDIIFFDGEEFGRPGSNDYCAGSKYFAQQIKNFYPARLPLAAIIIDMVGDKELSFPPEASSVRKALMLNRLIWGEALKLNLSAFASGLGKGLAPGQPRPQSRWIVDDHTPFQDLNIPASLIIDLDYPHWHTHQDTLDKVSPQSLKQTGLALLASLKKLDQISNK